MDEQLYRSMLFDFYGELLTEKQQDCFHLHFNEDLSLGEIAEDLGISRQAVWDNIRRAEELLKRNEEKIGLVARHVRLRTQAAALAEKAGELRDLTDGRAGELAAELCRGIQELQDGI